MRFSISSAVLGFSGNFVRAKWANTKLMVKTQTIEQTSNVFLLVLGDLGIARIVRFQAFGWGLRV